ncbi:glycosyltransferase [Neolewinella antarctica]|uniref:Glycosyltransferase involved in cell wall biosynthesis n=1 Tax=Neolewinella antarctica TaxID=442734 RepID=A0ABX0XDX4_9BACT|nr:glycosyltransferase [Neolewinella antarctica]NJC27451.1 glycosyltransferase involved in cell wall biosynthesis [Neolewinella antarctica]
MNLHVITPVINEADNLRVLLPFLVSELAGRGSITIADGGSTDETASVIAANPGVRHLLCDRCGRATQMNEAARNHVPEADVVYFVHADTTPPKGFYNDIQSSVKAGNDVGCYRFKFDTFHPLLSINAFCTRFKGLACRGGDQSLFLTHRAFDELGGFRDMKIMEDYDIIQRTWASDFNFHVMPRNILVSARKYRVNGWYRVQMANLKVFRMYKAGAPQEAMVSTYKQMLDPW